MPSRTNSPFGLPATSMAFTNSSKTPPAHSRTPSHDSPLAGGYRSSSSSSASHSWDGSALEINSHYTPLPSTSFEPQAELELPLLNSSFLYPSAYPRGPLSPLSGGPPSSDGTESDSGERAMPSTTETFPYEFAFESLSSRDSQQRAYPAPTPTPIRGNTWGYPASGAPKPNIGALPFLSQYGNNRDRLRTLPSPFPTPSMPPTFGALPYAIPSSECIAQYKRSFEMPVTDPQHWPQTFRNSDSKKAVAPAKKQVMACLFCRERKIGCIRPSEDEPDQTCNQCVRRKRICKYPTESRRGQHARGRMSVNSPRQFLGLDDLQANYFQSR
ncbi:hypothetical protein C8F01DRAFT_1144990 [Mycena amicta]|nr:hypothetical protein C8F01DRAFT_1144990 [Mycena amicta]